jgi:hypothetical protein
MQIDLGDLPGWVEAVATTGAFIAAIVAYRSLSHQVNLLRIQVQDQQEFNRAQIKALEAETKLRRQDQASRVFVEFFPEADPSKLGNWVIRVVNTSNRPIYRLLLNWTASGHTWEYREISVIMQESNRRFSKKFRDSAIGDLGATLVFDDAAGVTWKCTNEGELTEFQSQSR